MSKYSISIRPFGSHAVLVEWPEKVEEPILDDILQFYTYLKDKYLKVNGWEMIPAYNSLTILHHSSTIEFKSFTKKLQKWYDEKNEIRLQQKSLWRLPVCYDLDFGIDLKEVSNQLNMSITELIDLHTKSTYTVYGIGFLPGFMYLGGLPRSLETHRKSNPRIKVEKGAVGIASKQTGVYPQESPGGWNIIGNCSVPMFDPKMNDPCFVSVGDKVQFYKIERAEYDLHKIECEVGIYKLEKIKIDA